MSRGERRAYMMRLIFESETGEAAAAVQKAKDKRRRPPGTGWVGEADVASDLSLAPTGSKRDGSPPKPPRMATPTYVDVTPFPAAPSAAPPAMPSTATAGTFPRRPMPSGAGTVYITSDARAQRDAAGLAGTVTVKAL